MSYPHTLSDGITVEWAATDSNKEYWNIPWNTTGNNWMDVVQDPQGTPDGGCYMLGSIAQTPISGPLAITSGSFVQPVPGASQLIIVKLDASGSVQWVKYDSEWQSLLMQYRNWYSSGNRSTCTVAPNGDLVVILEMAIQHNDNYGFVILRVTQTGSKVFTRFIPPTEISGLKRYRRGRMCVDNNNNIYYATTASSQIGDNPFIGNEVPAIIKFSGTDGSILSVVTPQELQISGGDTRGTSIITDGTNLYIHVFVIGSISSQTSGGSWRVGIAKLNSNLQVQWILENPSEWAIASNRNQDIDHGFHVGPDGNLYMIIHTDNVAISGGDTNSHVVSKVNASTGSVMWATQNRTYLESGGSWRYADLTVTNTEDIYVANAYSNSTNINVFSLTKLNSLGVPQWIIKENDNTALQGYIRMNNTNDAVAPNPSIALASDGNLNITWMTFEISPAHGSHIFVRGSPVLVKVNIDTNSTLASDSSLITNLADTTESRSAFKAGLRDILSPSRSNGLSLQLGDKITNIFASASNTVTASTLLRVPARIGERQYRIDNETLSVVRSESRKLYIPEEIGADVTLTFADGVSRSITLSDTGVVYNGTTYGIDETIPLTDSLEYTVIGIGSVLLEQVENDSGDICFPEGTLITTDQGEIAIQNITPFRNTIRGIPILAVTRTIPRDRRIVVIPENAFVPGHPSREMKISLNHKIFLSKHRSIKARHLVGKLPGVVFERHGKNLYNVLLPNYSYMEVNSIPVETLDPSNPVAQAYILAYLVTAGKMTVEEARRTIRHPTA